MFGLDSEILLVPPLLAAVLAFSICALAYPFYIKWLSSKQIGQFIREDGPASHAVKAKTPTMGGLCFIFGILIAVLIAIYGFDQSGEILKGPSRSRALFALVAAVLCGLLGFADDFGKVMSKSNAGISAKLRLLCEFGLGLALAIGFFFLPPIFISMGVSRGTGQAHTFLLTAYPEADMLFRYMLVPFIMAATSNALNLHDGMDGLAGGTSFIVFVTMAIMLMYIPGCMGLGWVAAATAGALLAFLLFNKYPARVFMGDTGSLFLGALMAGLVVYGGLVFWFIPLALIYILETLSVISQVIYFKLTKPFTPEKPMSKIAIVLFKLTHKLPGQGKRLWRMAPLHHHFEALAAEKGVREWQVVLCFWLAQFLLCAICLAAFLFLA